MRLLKYFLITLFLHALLLSSTVYSAEIEKRKDNIAVLDFSGRNFANEDAAIFSDFLRTSLVKTGMYNVLDKANMDKVLSELSFQQTGITDTEYAAKLGKMLNVQKMVVGTVSKLDQCYYINANLVNVQSGQIEKSEVLNCDRSNEFLNVAKDLAACFTTPAQEIREEFKESKSTDIQEVNLANKSATPLTIHKKIFSLGIGNPYISLGYDISRKFTTELRYAADLARDKNDVKIVDLRLYYYGLNTGKVGWYVSLEGGTISFIGYDPSSAKVTQSGYSIGTYFGTKVNLTQTINMIIDCGPSYINLGNGTVDGVEWIVNTGLNWYIF